jgi:hypothetical protein
MSEVLDPVSGLGEASRARAIELICHVEGAVAFLKVAHAGDRVRIELTDDVVGRAHAGHRGWYSSVLTKAAAQLHRIIVVFDKHPARGPDAGAEIEAFRVLADLTTAGPQLQVLIRRNRALAIKELATHLDLVRQQFEATAALEDTLAAPDTPEGDNSTRSQGDAFEGVSSALLERAGGALSLTQATKLLGVSRQALHKRIAAGTALGMMIGSEIAVPKLQFSETGGRQEILPGIGPVTKLFKDTQAGPWMALQFLVDPDPNLGKSPIEALRAGEDRVVEQAARAYLHRDEE